MFTVWNKTRLSDFYSIVFRRHSYLRVNFQYQNELFETGSFLETIWENFIQEKPIYFPSFIGGISTKDELRKKSKEPSYLSLQPFATFKTSGTSGVPLSIKRDLLSSSDFCFSSLVKNCLKRPEIQVGKSNVFSCFVSDKPGSSDIALINPTDRTGLLTRVRLRSQNSNDMMEVFNKLNDLRPEIITSKPNVLEMLLEFRRSGCALTFKPAAIVSSGAMLTQTLKGMVEETFECPVIDSYNSTEFGYIASTCSYGKMHIDASSCLVEDGGDETGILISSRMNPYLTFSRYTVGDRGKISNGDCLCGQSNAFFESFSGRTVPQFILPCGRKYSPTCFMNIFLEFPRLEEFQLTQKSHYHYNFRIQSQDDNAEELVKYIKGFISAEVKIEYEFARIQKCSKFERYRQELYE